MAEDLQSLIEQLKQISPMPDDDDLTYEILEKYELLLEKFRQVKDPAIIEPLLYSIGFYDAYGGYSSVMNTLEKYEIPDLLPPLIEATKHGQRGTRYWAAKMLGRIGSLEVVPSLLALLSDPEEEVRAEAIRALAKSDDPNFAQYIKPLENDDSPEVRRAVERALSRV